MHPTQENDQKSCFWLFGSFKKAFLRFLNDPAWVVQWRTHANHLVLSKFAIWSRLDGPKSRKWTKTSFLAIWIIQKWFLNDPAWPDDVAKCCKHLVLSQYAISSWSDQPIWRKWPILNRIIQKYIFVIFEWSGIFPEKPPCTFLALIVRNFHAKNQRNPYSRFWEKLSPNY